MGGDLVIQAALSLASVSMSLGIVTVDGKGSMLVIALVAGQVAGFFEEIGWTGSRRSGVAVVAISSTRSNRTAFVTEAVL